MELYGILDIVHANNRNTYCLSKVGRSISFFKSPLQEDRRQFQCFYLWCKLNHSKPSRHILSFLITSPGIITHTKLQDLSGMKDFGFHFFGMLLLSPSSTKLDGFWSFFPTRVECFLLTGVMIMAEWDCLAVGQTCQLIPPVNLRQGPSMCWKTITENVPNISNRYVVFNWLQCTVCASRCHLTQQIGTLSNPKLFDPLDVFTVFLLYNEAVHGRHSYNILSMGSVDCSVHMLRTLFGTSSYTFRISPNNYKVKTQKAFYLVFSSNLLFHISFCCFTFQMFVSG